MNTRKISWEIVLAGIAFVGIGIYLFNQSTTSKSDSSSASVWQSGQAPSPPSAPKTPSLPGAIVIDLQNLQNLQNLEQLKNLKELEELDKIIRKHIENEKIEQNVESNLEKLETELEKIEETDFKIKLQDRKVFINKDYKVDEARWTEVSPGVYVFRQTFAAENLRSMELDIGFGNVNIVGNDGQNGEITLRATGNFEDPAELTDKMRIQQRLGAEDAVFKLSSSNGSSISNRVNLEATLTLPSGTRLAATTAGGHINANNLKSKKSLSTSGGHITLNTIAGETEAKTGGGHITCNEISGNTLLKTGGGHIKVTGAKGALTAKTGGGHIEIQKAEGSVTANTAGGNISTSVVQAGGPLKFSTSAGNVSLELPKAINANLEVSGSSASLSEVFNFSGTREKGRIDGTINGGGVPVVVNCEYGNVNISTRN